MNVNPFGSNSIYTNSTPNTMNANQSGGLRFGASSDDYDYYNSSVPKKKESFWQKWKKVIIGGFVTVGVGILGIVGYNKGWFSKAKNVATNGSSQTKPNNFETALKTLGLEDLKVEGKDIKNLLKNDTKTVSQKQFTDVVIAIHGKVENSSNEIKIAAVTILEQLRKNLAQDATIEGFDKSKEIENVNVLDEIITALEPVQPGQPGQPVQPGQSAESVQPESTSQNTTDLNNDIDSTPTDISVPPVQPTKSPTEAQELRERTQETEKKKVEEQLKNKGLNDDVIVALLDDKKEGKKLQTIIENTVPIANRLTNLIDKTPDLKDNAAFKSLVTSFLTTVNENKEIDELLKNDDVRDSIANLLNIVMQDRNHFGINKKHILNPLVKKVCSIEEKSEQQKAYIVKEATYYTINCLAAAIDKGIINGTLAFAQNAITKDNAGRIARALYFLIPSNNPPAITTEFKSLVTSFLTTVNENKEIDELLKNDDVRNNIAELLDKVMRDGNRFDVNNSILSSLVKKVCLEKEKSNGNDAYVVKNPTSDIINCLATAIKQKVIKQKVIKQNLKFAPNAITKDNAGDIASALTNNNYKLKKSESQPLVTSFYKTCLTQKGVITKDNAKNIFDNLAVIIEKGVIKGDFTFKEGVITKDNIGNIASALKSNYNKLNKSLVTSFLTAVNKNDKLLEDKDAREALANLLEDVTQDRNHPGVDESILTSLVKKVCSISEKDNVIENATSDIISCLATYIEKGVINGALAFAPNAITDTNVCDIANILTINYNKFNKNKSLVTSFLTAVNENEKINKLLKNDDDVRGAIANLLKKFMQDSNHPGVDKPSLTSLVKKVCSISEKANVIENATYKTIDCLATAIEKGVINGTLAFGANAITDTNAGDIAETLTQLINGNDKLINNPTFKSLVTSFYQTCLTQNVIKVNNAGNIISGLATYIEKGAITDEEKLEFKTNAITRDNAGDIARAFENNSKLEKSIFQPLLTSFYKICLTQNVINANNADNIISGLATYIEKGAITDEEKLEFKTNAITKDNIGHIASALNDISKLEKSIFQPLVVSFVNIVNDNKGLLEGDDVGNIAGLLTRVVNKNDHFDVNTPTLSSLVNSFLTAVNKNDKLLKDKNVRNDIAKLLTMIVNKNDHFGVNTSTLSSLVKKVCLEKENSHRNGVYVVVNATIDTINCLAFAIKQSAITDEEKLEFKTKAITKDNAGNIADTLTTLINKDKQKLTNNSAFKSLVTSFLTAVNEKKDEFINQNSEKITQLLETFCKECNQTDNVASEPKLYKVIDALKKRINSTSLTNIENWLKHCESAAFTPINVISVSDDEVKLAEEEFIRKHTLPNKALNEYNKDELVLYINTYLSSINCLSIDNKKVQSMNQQQLFEVARSIQKHEVFIKNNSAKLGEEKNVLYNNEIIRYCNDHNPNNPIWNNCSYIEDSENVSKNHGCWKMHIYIDREDDYQKIAPIIIEYFRTENLKNHSVENKTLRHISPELFQLYSFSQSSKGFTIYPPYNPENKDNVKSMEKIAKDLDKLIREHNLTISKSEIPGDRQMGKTGRLFYRYEYASINDNHKEYSSDLYDVNRANKGLKYAYLPKDGQDPETYDPWFNFDPAE